MSSDSYFTPREKGKEEKLLHSKPVRSPRRSRQIDSEEPADVVHRLLLVKQLVPVGLSRLLDVVRVHQLEVAQTVGAIDEDVVPVFSGPETPHLVRRRAARLRP